MILPTGQAIVFKGRDAKERADQLVAEEGADMVEVVYHRESESKVRFRREFVIESRTTQRLRAQAISNHLCGV